MHRTYDPLPIRLDGLDYGQVVLLETAGLEEACTLDLAWLDAGGEALRYCDPEGRVLPAVRQPLFADGRPHVYPLTVPRGAQGLAIEADSSAALALAVERHEDFAAARRAVELRWGPSTCSGLKAVAHLGFIGFAPRNTMAAFDLACRAGFRECVLNVNVSADDVLVALHDNEIGHTSDGAGEIQQLRYAEAARHDYGGWMHPVYRGERLPRVSEVLDLLLAWDVRPVLRITERLQPAHLLALHELCRSRGLLGRTTLKVFDLGLLETLRPHVAATDYRWGLCLEEDDAARVTRLQALGGEAYLDVYYPRIDAALLERCAARGLEVEAWIINDWWCIMELARRGVTGFTTDDYNFELLR